MDMPTSPLWSAFTVIAVFRSHGEQFAHEEYRIDVPLDAASYAAARARAEQSTYANARVPGLGILLVVTPFAPPDPEPRPPAMGSGDLEVGCYLVLSTEHVRCTTAALLDQWADLSAIEQPLAVARTHYGWFIPTRSIPATTTDAFPEELPELLGFARARGCERILFDCDGPKVPSLPIFPW